MQDDWDGNTVAAFIVVTAEFRVTTGERPAGFRVPLAPPVLNLPGTQCLGYCNTGGASGTQTQDPAVTKHEDQKNNNRPVRSALPSTTHRPEPEAHAPRSARRGQTVCNKCTARTETQPRSARHV